MFRLRTFGLIVLAAIAAFAGYHWLAADPRLKLSDREPFTKGGYQAYAQPWGGMADPLVRIWAPHADAIHVDVARFPDRTRLSYFWPAWRPRNHGGVWAYVHIGYGDYDGGVAEVPVAPRRVDALRQLSQTVAWRPDGGFGRANLLTEFYLRADPRKPESKRLEIGWLLHAPRATQTFVDEGRQLGTWTDPSGRAWQAAITDRYVTFLPAGREDVREATIDMLAALRWLREKGLVRGDEWVTGVAIGAEPLKGYGRFEIDRWRVAMR